MENVSTSQSKLSGIISSMSRGWFALPAGFHAVLGTILVMGPISPFAMPILRRDSGVFLYAGWRILSGEIPYKEIWDHKPPLIFYINALGLSLGNGSRWGVWGLEAVSLFIAILLGIKIINNAFGKSPAVLATYLWLLGLTGLMSGGNYTTEYALPIQFACFWLYTKPERDNRFSLKGYLLGIFCCIAFLLKQNNIGVGLAITLHILVIRLFSKHYKVLAVELMAIAGGVLTVSVGVAAVLIHQEAVSYFWDAAFVYNYLYIAATITERLVAVLKGIVYLNGFALLALAGWWAAFLLVLKRTSLPQIPNRFATIILEIGLIDLPIELLLLASTGNSHRHYYMTLLPVFAIFAGFALWLSQKKISAPRTPRPEKRRLLFFSITFFTVSIISAGTALISDFTFPARRSFDYNAVNFYIQQNTERNDYVLLWGAETSINFTTQRRSPSRFSYQYPLYLEGYANASMIEEFLDDINKNKPELIIDTGNSLTPFFNFRVRSAKVEELIRTLKEQYKVTGQFGSWVIYKYMGDK